MSLIRAGSNPEGLYVYGGCDQDYHVSAGGAWSATNCNSAKGQPSMVIPEVTFEAAMEAWRKNFNDEPIEINGFRIEFADVFLDDGSAAPKYKPFTERLEETRPRDYLIRWSFNDLFVCMHEVTMEHIISAHMASAVRSLLLRAETLREDYSYWNGHDEKEAQALAHAGALLAKDLIRTLDEFAEEEED